MSATDRDSKESSNVLKRIRDAFFKICTAIVNAMSRLLRLFGLAKKEEVNLPEQRTPSIVDEMPTQSQSGRKSHREIMDAILGNSSGLDKKTPAKNVSAKKSAPATANQKTNKNIFSLFQECLPKFKSNSKKPASSAPRPQ
jgi:hypothetical protein